MKEIILGVILIVSIVFDIKTKKVPNKLIIIAFLLGVTIKIYEKGAEGISLCILFVLIIAILFPTYLLGALGAGDVKLFGIISMFIGFYNTLYCFLYSLILCSIWGGFALLYCYINQRGNTEKGKRHKVYYTIFIFFAFLYVMYK